MNVNNGVQLLALVPHRDVRLVLQRWSAALFAAGLPGAWSFPWVAPLATLKRPLAAAELKTIAKSMRKDMESGNQGSGIRDRGEWFANIEGCQHIPIPDNSPQSPSDPRSPIPVPYSILGIPLNLKLSETFFEPIIEAIDFHCAKPVLGAAVLDGALPDDLKGKLPEPPPISFRVAALANMFYRIENDAFFSWKIGTLHWLPRK